MNLKMETCIQILIKRYYIIQTLKKYTSVWLVKCHFDIYPGLFKMSQKSELEIGQVTYSSCTKHCGRSKEEEDEVIAFRNSILYSDKAVCNQFKTKIAL